MIVELLLPLDALTAAAWTACMHSACHRLGTPVHVPHRPATHVTFSAIALLSVPAQGPCTTAVVKSAQGPGRRLACLDQDSVCVSQLA